MKQIDKHGIRPSPGEGKPPPGNPGQQKQAHCSTCKITGQPQRRSVVHRAIGRGMIEEGHSCVLSDPCHSRPSQSQESQRRQPQLFPGNIRLHHHAQPKIRKKHHRPGTGHCSVQPGNVSGKTSQHHRECQNPSLPLAPAEPEPEPGKARPENHTQQIPQMPPGCQPGNLTPAEEHRRRLAYQINRQRPFYRPEAIPFLSQKQTGEERKQGHMYQINHPILRHQCFAAPDPRLDPVSIYHRDYQNQFQIAIPSVQ